VVTKIEEFSNTLPTLTDPRDRADALCFLLHFFGDIHQPLHCVTRVTSQFPLPDGDRGGNSFKLRGHWKNLHSLWDDSVNLQSKDDPDELASEIMQKHDRKSLESDLASKDPRQWALDSYDLAVREAYTLEEDDDNPPTPPLSYLHNAMAIAQRQAALAGYRLADALKELLTQPGAGDARRKPNGDRPVVVQPG
jgi:hypothetical protein